VLSLPSAARQQYTANGLRMPWYSAYGNHDALVQGNVPVGFDLFGINVRDFATGNFKPSAILGIPDQFTSGASDIYDLVTAGIFHDMAGVQVPADPDRRLLTPVPVRPGALHHHRHPQRARLHGRQRPGVLRDPCGGRRSGAAHRAGHDVHRRRCQWLARQHAVAVAGGATAGQQFPLPVRDPESVLTTVVNQPGVEDKLFVIYSHHTSNSMDNFLAHHVEDDAHDGRI
jgi:hypothetical protein